MRLFYILDVWKHGDDVDDNGLDDGDDDDSDGLS